MTGIKDAKSVGWGPGGWRCCGAGDQEDGDVVGPNVPSWGGGGGGDGSIVCMSKCTAK